MIFGRLSIEFISDTTKMEYPRIIGTGDVHRTRIENQQPKLKKGLDKAKFELKSSIVRLEFNFGGGAHYGTGFFVNFPTNKHDVILTAAHNLINEAKATAQDLMIIYENNGKEEAKEFRICPQYEEHLGKYPKPPGHGYYDYGVILLPKNESHANKRQGLGLNLSLNLHPTLRELRDAFVSGFGGGSDDVLQTSSGPLEKFGNQIEYQATTEQGMSGSPVWVTYDGQTTVIGIHNMRPARKGAGSRGTKITEQVLRDLCLWAGIGFFGKRLCAPGGKGKSHNTYLSFPQNSDFAKVFLGSSSAAVVEESLTFDIIPAYMFPRWTNQAPLYAFKLHKPPSWDEQKKHWVEWQPERQRAVLVGTLKDVNLVKLMEKQTGKATRYSVVMIAKGEDRGYGEELRLHDGGREEDDIEDGMTEFAGVSFGEFKELGILGSRYFKIE
ncbi:trypsin-like cysteine/serine peptidase domain-containing protein [Trichoderma ceciliae]